MKAQSLVIPVLAAALTLGMSGCAVNNYQARRPAPLPPCYTQAGFSNTTLAVTYNVYPGAGKKWSYDDSPMVIASHVESRLNADGRANGLSFAQANGVTPNLYVNITLDDVGAATGNHRYVAYVEVTGLGRGFLFRDSSGEAPFVNGNDALNRLTDNIYNWMSGGWHSTPGTCRDTSGTSTGYAKKSK
jgi:hypothetical protein